MKYLENCTAQEVEALKNALPQIAALVAGADGNVDQDESAWAEKLIHIRGYANPKALQEFYDALDMDFNQRFETILANLPTNLAAAQAYLSSELSQLNPILARLDPKYAYQFYHSLITYADHIARATGGIMGFGSISREEEKVVHLPMITPISPPSENE